jgi:uncharacterized membrane protein YkvI
LVFAIWVDGAVVDFVHAVGAVCAGSAFHCCFFFPIWMPLVLISAVALMFFPLVVGYVSLSLLSGVLSFLLPIYLKVALNCSFSTHAIATENRWKHVCVFLGTPRSWKYEVAAAEQFDADVLIQRSW